MRALPLMLALGSGCGFVAGLTDYAGGPQPSTGTGGIAGAGGIGGQAGGGDPSCDEALPWARVFESDPSNTDSPDVRVGGMVPDASCGLFVTLRSRGAIAGVPPATSTDGANSYVLHLDHAGDLLWTAAVGGPDHQRIHSMSLGNDQLLVAGNFEGDIVLGDETVAAGRGAMAMVLDPDTGARLADRDVIARGSNFAMETRFLHGVIDGLDRVQLVGRYAGALEVNGTGLDCALGTCGMWLVYDGTSVVHAVDVAVTGQDPRVNLEHALLVANDHTVLAGTFRGDWEGQLSSNQDVMVMGHSISNGERFRYWLSGSGDERIVGLAPLPAAGDVEAVAALIVHSAELWQIDGNGAQMLAPAPVTGGSIVTAVQLRLDGSSVEIAQPWPAARSETLWSDDLVTRRQLAAGSDDPEWLAVAGFAEADVNLDALGAAEVIPAGPSIFAATVVYDGAVSMFDRAPRAVASLTIAPMDDHFAGRTARG